MWNFNTMPGMNPTGQNPMSNQMQTMQAPSNGMQYPYGGTVNWSTDTNRPDAYVPQGSQIQYQDNATAAGNQFGWGDPRAQGNLTRDVTRYQNALTRENLNNNTAFLNNNMTQGFANNLTGVENLFDQYASYGGLFGGNSNPTYSPMAKPQNGYQQGGGLFNIGTM